MQSTSTHDEGLALMAVFKNEQPDVLQVSAWVDSVISCNDILKSWSAVFTDCTWVNRNAASYGCVHMKSTQTPETNQNRLVMC